MMNVSNTGNTALVVIGSLIVGGIIAAAGIALIAFIVRKFSKKPYSRRPEITAIAILLAIGLLFDVQNLFSGKLFSPSYLPVVLNIFTVLSSLVSIVWIYGLWKNRKWAVYGMFSVALLGNLLVLFTGSWSITQLGAFIVPLLTLPFISEMK